ncbi:GNAT family N-acetyltransferase [Streptomyces sp. NPDC057702]|uniref:GNAT family N-acetyltransferase n=1 Tax=unclassified Streptomyces TaxID=2593676 RepID=UPI0036C34015
MTSDVRIRLVEDTDWTALAALEERAYAGLGLSEGEAALRSRARVSPDTCTVLDRDGHLVGYLLALPYPPFHSPDLAHAEPTSTATPTRNLHLHDLVVAPEHRGAGLARRLLRHLTATARAAGYEQISLVAVAGSAAFWAGHGFRPHPEVPLPDSYGPDARYMSAPVPTGRRAPAPGPPRTPRPGAPVTDEVG